MAASAAARQLKPEANVNPLIAGLEDLSLFNQKFKRRGEITALLDHSKKKLSSLDSQRIISVLDDLIQKCEVVTLLPFIVENMHRFSVMIGIDLQSALKEYDELQENYTKCLSSLRKIGLDCSPSHSTQQFTSKSFLSSMYPHELNTNKSSNCLQLTERQSVVTATNLGAAQLSNIVKKIIRLFRLNPSALKAIKGERQERSFEANNYIDVLYMLREQLQARLVTTSAEEREKAKTTVQVMMREKKSQAQIKKLEVELQKAAASKDKMIHEKNEEIRKLKTSIQTIENDSDLVNRKFFSDAQKIEAAEVKNAEGKKSKLQQEMIQLNQTFQTTTKAHRENELTLRRRKFKMETEVENWVQKYDNDMTERQDEIDLLTEVYAEEKKQLEELEKRFGVLKKEYDVIMEERRLALAKREKAEIELRAMVKAATLLQAFWRAYKCRKALKAKQKKTNKSKGKGKRKKKMK